MKKIIIFTILIIFCLFSISCLIKITEQEDIQMKNEIITIELSPDSADINLDYEFENYSDNNLILNIGFPADDYLAYSLLTDFVSYPYTEKFVVISNGEIINNIKKKQESYIHPLESNIHKAYFYKYKESYEYVSLHNTVISYTVDTHINQNISTQEPFNQYDRMCVYIIHTGKYWKYDIETLEIRIINTDPSQIQDVSFHLFDTHQVNQSPQSFFFEHIEPEENIFVFYNLSN